MDSENVTKEHFEEERVKRLQKINAMIKEALGKEEMEEEKRLPTIQGTAVIFETEPYAITDLDPYQMAFFEQHIKSFRIPAMSALMRKQMDLQKALRTPEMFAGLIVGSCRTVDAITINFQENEEQEKQRLLSMWQSKVNFCAYETTAKALKDKMGLDSLGSNAGCMINLAKIIKETPNSENYKPYLFPCSYSRNFEFIRHMQISELKIRILPCYKTIGDKRMLERWTQVVAAIQGLPEIIVLSTPTAVLFANEMLHYQQNRLCTFTIIALGPSTQARLYQCQIKPALVVLDPTPEVFAEKLHKFLTARQHSK